MRHATVKLGEYTIPLFGISPDETQEKCDRCGRRLHLTEVVLMATEFVCVDCSRAEYEEK